MHSFILMTNIFFKYYKHGQQPIQVFTLMAIPRGVSWKIGTHPPWLLGVSLDRFSPG